MGIDAPLIARDELKLATEFWSETRGSALLGAMLAARMTAAASAHEDEEEDAFRGEVDKIIADMGYGLNLATLQARREDVRRSQLAYWRGLYLLRLAEHDYQLVVDDTTASCRIEDCELVFASFADRRLVLKDEAGKVSLTVDFRENDPDPDNLDRASGIGYCAGTLLRADGTEGAIVGKDGCFFPGSIDWDHRGDPLDAWAGGYLLYSAETGETDGERLIVEPDGAVRLGTVPLRMVIWGDNKLIAEAGNSIGSSRR